MSRHPVLPTFCFARLAQETLLAPNHYFEGKSRRCQHRCSLVAEKAKLAVAAARRQKKAQKKSKQKLKKELHLAAEVPHDDIEETVWTAAEVPQEDAEDTVLAADEASNSGAGPSTASNALASAQEVCSLARVQCDRWSATLVADAEMEKVQVLARVARSPSLISLSGTVAVSTLGGDFVCLESCYLTH